MPVYLFSGGKPACTADVKMQRKSNCADKGRFWSSVRLDLAGVPPGRRRDPTYIFNLK